MQNPEEPEQSKQLNAPDATEEKLQNLPASANPHESPLTKIGTDDDGFVDPIEEELPEFGARPSRKRVGIFCFNCNRPDGHFLPRQHRWYYSYLVGLTFGLVKIVGPYQCQCCGARRFMCSDWISLRYLLRRLRDRRVSKSKKGKSPKGFG